MQQFTPKVPPSIDQFAEATLAQLRGNPAVGSSILGEGFAMQHYIDFRATHDVDAWRAHAPDANASAAVQNAVRTVAETRGLRYRERLWRDVVASYEIFDAAREGTPTVFFVPDRVARYCAGRFD